MEIDRRVRIACKDVKVKYVKLSPYSAVLPDVSVKDAISLMNEKNLSCVIVKDDWELLGILTERDVLNKIAGDKELLSKPVSEFMKPNPKVLTGDELMGKGIEMMNSEGCRRIPITDKKGRCVGILHAKHILDCLVDYFQEEIYNLPPMFDQVYKKAEGG